MNTAIPVGVGAVVLIIAYFSYGRRIGRWLGVDPDRPTPAHTMRDNIDYVPAKMPILLGHHFASIAGAGPIVGPVIAAAYGWLPAYIWIVVGVIFMGAMFDFSVIVASIRHQGKSIGEVIEENVGALGKMLFLAFSWAALILVIAVFTSIVADTFVGTPAVATSSLLFILVAIIFGFGVYRRGVNLWIASVIGVALLFACVYIGTRSWAGLDLTGVRAASKAVAAAEERAASLPEASPEKAKAQEDVEAKRADLAAKKARAKVIWSIVLFAYVFCAAVMPVWLLLQPRDYLNSFLLYAVLIMAVAGSLFAGARMVLPAVKTFNAQQLGPMFPLLFVTVACGAISGFHCLVGSGTTAKQLSNERDAQPVGYGAMLIEGMLAIVAICAVASLTAGQLKTAGSPIEKFSLGVGVFVKSLGVPVGFARVFVSLAISAFALTSLDTGTRLARFAMQEFFEMHGAKREDARPSLVLSFLRNRFVATAVTVVFSAVLLSAGTKRVWPVFGSANQLLAALGLLAISVWLARAGKKNLFTVIPMIFMFCVTLSALGILIFKNIRAVEPNYLLAGIGVGLFGLAIVLLGLSVSHLRPAAPAGEEN